MSEILHKVVFIIQILTMIIITTCEFDVVSLVSCIHWMDIKVSFCNFKLVSVFFDILFR